MTCDIPIAVRNGHIKRITDSDIASSVLEIQSANVSTTYISCPADQAKTLGIKLPFLILIVKNLKKYFTFEVQVLDDKNVRRRFRASNYQVQSPYEALKAGSSKGVPQNEDPYKNALIRVSSSSGHAVRLSP